MKYLWLNVIVLGLVIGSLRLLKVRPHRRALRYTLVFVLVLTAFFDSLIVWSGIVAYYPGAYLGVLIGKAPVEDFAYAIAAVLLAANLWEYFDAKS